MRNVVVQGDEGSLRTGFGGQVMVMGGGAARLSGVELYRMGQKNNLRRYPIHFHMLGDGGERSWVRDTSIRTSFNRCLTIHGTNRLRVERTVAHDTLGHCYFLEDGAETQNVLENNLGLLTRRPPEGERLLPSDANPATYWVTHPANTLRGNVAAGSQGFGFWLAYPEHPTGLSKSEANDRGVWPRRTPLGVFEGNVAHSNDHTGLHVDDGPRADGSTEATWYGPRQNPVPPSSGQPDSAAVPADFKNFFGYKNRQRGAWLRGHALTMSGAVLADNAIGATFAASETTLTNALVVGESANKGDPRSWEAKGEGGRSLPQFWDAGFPIRGFEFYDGRVGASGVTFARFRPTAARQASALGYLRDNRFDLDPRNFADSLSYVDANPVYLEDPAPERDGDRSAVFLDRDGSVGGSAGKVVVANVPFLLDASCAARAEWNAFLCGGAYGTLSLERFDGPGLGALTVRRDDGAAQPLAGTASKPGEARRVETSLLVGRAYAADLGAAPPKLRLALRRRSVGDSVRLTVPALAQPHVYRDYNRGKPLARLADLTDLETSEGYVLDASGLTVKLTVSRADRDWGVIEVCARSGCN